MDLIFRIVDLGTVLHKVLQAESSRPPTSSTTTSVLESVTGWDKNVWYVLLLYCVSINGRGDLILLVCINYDFAGSCRETSRHPCLQAPL